MAGLFKSNAIAALTITTALPAHSAAHLHLNSMTCGIYYELSGVDRDAVAMLAVT